MRRFIDERRLPCWPSHAACPLTTDKEALERDEQRSGMDLTLPQLTDSKPTRKEAVILPRMKKGHSTYPACSPCTGKYFGDSKRPWSHDGAKYDIALPCATQNEVNKSDAEVRGRDSPQMSPATRSHAATDEQPFVRTTATDPSLEPSRT